MRHTTALLASLALFSAAGCSSSSLGSTTQEQAGHEDAGTDTGTPTPDSGTDGHAPLSTVPIHHRPSPVACPTSPASSPTGPQAVDAGVDAGPPSTNATCTTDAECGVNDGLSGKCVSYADAGSKECNYDQCAGDTDCSGGGVCSCEGQTFGYAHGSPGNSCVPANCRVDSDCGQGGYCSPTVSSDCGGFYGTQGWYCHTSADECTNDTDCGYDGGTSTLSITPYCAYSTEVGHWVCGTSACAG